MGSRKKWWDRCPRCRMRREKCLCAEIPRLPLATRVVLLMHKSEALAPTNTGYLASLALPNSVILVRGRPDDVPDVAAHVDPALPSVLLYPADDAPPLSPAVAQALGGPVNLLVPDGNWRQASKMRRRDPFLATLPCVQVPPGPPTAYHVRHETMDGGLATMEAIARALGVLEGPAVQEALEALFALMVKRTLEARGRGS